MKKTMFTLVLAGTACFTIGKFCNFVEHIAAHYKYKKGWRDGVEFAIAMQDLKDTIDKIQKNEES